MNKVRKMACVGATVAAISVGLPVMSSQAAASAARAPAASCPTSGSLCDYADRNYLSFVGSHLPPGSYTFSGAEKNSISSARNRTNCSVRFFRYSGTSTIYTSYIPPQSEVPSISAKFGTSWNDAIDGAQFSC